jgi:radical SAM superfamily enzyme YgiQ (UPF0313 family)
MKKDPPMGVLYIASSLETGGYNVDVIDAHAEELTMDAVIARVKKISPQIIGISCNYAPLHNITMELCERIKTENKDIITVVGGNHASATAPHLLGHCRDIDFIILGQGEYIFPSLIRAISSNIQGIAGMRNVLGIAYMEDGNYVKTQSAPIISNLDELPLPAYHLVNMGLYERYNIVTSRGCPFQCNYCASNIITKHHVKYRKPKMVLNEIKMLVEKHGKKHFWFSDDTFTSNKLQSMELMDLIIDSGIDIEWSCLTRANTTSKELLKKMKLAGCKYISYGVESASDDMLRDMNKKLTIETIETAVTDTKDAGIDVYLFFIVGYPGDTMQDEMNGIDFVKRVCPKGTGYNIFIPLPGTTCWKQLEGDGLVGFDTIEWDKLFMRTSWDDHDDYSAKLASTWCSLTPEEIIDVCNRGESACQVVV